MVCSKTISCRLCIGYRKNRSFWLWFRPCEKLTEFFRSAESATHTFMGFHRRYCGDPLYITGIMVHFRYYRKKEVVFVCLKFPIYRSGLNRTDKCIPCNTDLRQFFYRLRNDLYYVEWDVKLYYTIPIRQISSRSVVIWDNASQKSCFRLTMEWRTVIAQWLRRSVITAAYRSACVVTF